MKSIEIHAIQSLPPSRTNRGENGEPKTSMFGGVPRSRVSSQAQKRQQRHNDQTMRTRLPHELIARELKDSSLRPLALALISHRYGTIDENGRLKNMVYLDRTEIQQFADMIETHKDELAELIQASAKAVADGKKQAIKDAEAALGKKLDELLSEYQPHISEDVALYGRFMADQRDEIVQAATSYAHALSVHRDQTSNDFFSAVDDVEGQSAHIGNLGLNAPTLYRYATIDLDLLARHIGQKNVKKVVEEWITGFLYATPQGGGHGAFARTLPEYILITYREHGHPVTLANAFAEPAYPHDGLSLLQDTLMKFKAQAAFNQEAYGYNGLEKALEISLHDYQVDNFPVQRVSSLPDAIKELPL